MTSRIKALSEAGQGIWLDFVDRGFLKDGGLDRLIAEDGLTGVTSNPSIFEKAIGQGQAYDEDLRAFLKAHPGASAVEAYESLAVADIQSAADALRLTYDRLGGKDGWHNGGQGGQHAVEGGDVGNQGLALDGVADQHPRDVGREDVDGDQDHIGVARALLEDPGQGPARQPGLERRGRFAVP